MIGYLNGKLISKNPDTFQCVVLSHRVGYELTVSPALFDKLGIDERVSLWIHTHVREDVLSLFGFATEAEKHFFRLLNTVSGLGPKSCLALLSEHGPEKTAHYIRTDNPSALATAPGIGKKLAQKMILELQPKMEKLAWLALAESPVKISKTEAAPRHTMREDLTSALVNLGFAPQQVKPAVERIFQKEEAEKEGFEACLRTALKEMGTRPFVAEGGTHG